MNVDRDPSTLKRLEQKVDNLTWLVSIQTMLLMFLALAYVLQFSRYIIYLLIIAVPLLYFCRRWLPQWARTLSGMWFRRQRGQVKAHQGPSR